MLETLQRNGKKLEQSQIAQATLRYLALSPADHGPLFGPNVGDQGLGLSVLSSGPARESGVQVLIPALPSVTRWLPPCLQHYRFSE